MDLKHIIITLALSGISYCNITAQEIETETPQDSTKIAYGEQPNDYIYIYKNRITAKGFYINTSNPLTIRNRNNTSDQYDLYPNKQDKIGVSVAFRSLAASYSFSPNSMAENQNDKNSKLVNFNLRTYFGNHWMQTLDIYSQKGFHLEGSVDNSDKIHGYLPKTKSFKIGGSTSYIFNENFSYRARANQTEKQLKSVGTFMPTLIYYYTKHDIIAYNTTSNIKEVDSDFKAFNIAIAPSYLYNFVPTKNLFISVGASAGIGINFSSGVNKLNPDDKDQLTSLLTEINCNGTLAYDINNFYIGAHYDYLILNHNSDSSSYVKDNIPYFQAFAGYRFKAPKKLVNKADDFNQKIKL